MDDSKKLFEQTAEGASADEGRERHGIQSVQNLETVINEGLRVALLEETPDQSLGVLLEHLGKALNGERTYIFEQNDSGCDDNTYEWVADGVAPEKENLQNVPPEVCASWYRKFGVGKHIVIESLEDIRESDPLQYENLKRQNIHSLVVVPLYDGKTVIGFYGVDNPPVKSLEYASRQPRFPQRQRGPWGSMIMCPSSPIPTTEPTKSSVTGTRGQAMPSEINR